MLELKLSTKPLWETPAEGYCFLIADNFEECKIIRKIEQDYYPQLRNLLKKHKFEGKKGQSYVLSAPNENKLIQFIFVGVGKLDGKFDVELENLRRAVGLCVHIIKKLELGSAVLSLPSKKMFDIDQHELVRQFTSTAYLAGYEFKRFKTEKKDDKYNGILYLASQESLHIELEEDLKIGSIIGISSNFTRNLADMPPNLMTPIIVADHAQHIAHEFGLKCKVLDIPQAKELGMGGFLAVQSGSDNEGRFVVLEYNYSSKAPTIALVGKGITFDSGGISLKPASSMTGMKYDMSGAAAVIGTLRAIAQLKPQVNVVGVIPLAENMPSGKATRQDDIVTFMNGKTAEIKNTDAEGRLILADALCYAEKYYSPDVIIDIATLTGACVVSLGLYFSGLMSKNDELADELIEVGKKTGDKLWRLPLTDDYEPAIKSDVADLANSGKSEYSAGTITAGLFLTHFVERTPYAHIDIAGTSDGVLGVSYIGKGATGVGVRLFIEYITHYNNRRSKKF